MNSIYFAYPRMAGSVDTEAVHFNWNTVELEGKGELESGILINRVRVPDVAPPR